MLDNRKRHEMEQGRAALVEAFPPLWWGLYKGMRGEGFTDDQAMALLLAYVRATCLVGETSLDPLEDLDDEEG